MGDSERADKANGRLTQSILKLPSRSSGLFGDPLGGHFGDPLGDERGTLVRRQRVSKLPRSFPLYFAPHKSDPHDLPPLLDWMLLLSLKKWHSHSPRALDVFQAARQMELDAPRLAADAQSWDPSPFFIRAPKPPRLHNVNLCDWDDTSSDSTTENDGGARNPSTATYGRGGRASPVFDKYVSPAAKRSRDMLLSSSSDDDSSYEEFKASSLLHSKRGKQKVALPNRAPQVKSPVTAISKSASPQNVVQGEASPHLDSPIIRTKRARKRARAWDSEKDNDSDDVELPTYLAVATGCPATAATAIKADAPPASSLLVTDKKGSFSQVPEATPTKQQRKIPLPGSARVYTPLNAAALASRKRRASQSDEDATGVNNGSDSDSGPVGPRRSLLRRKTARVIASQESVKSSSGDDVATAAVNAAVTARDITLRGIDGTRRAEPPDRSMECPMCLKYFSESELQKHVNECLDGAPVVAPPVVNRPPPRRVIECPICQLDLDAMTIAERGGHVNKCLSVPLPARIERTGSGVRGRALTAAREQSVDAMSQELFSSPPAKPARSVTAPKAFFRPNSAAAVDPIVIDDDDDDEVGDSTHESEVEEAKEAEEAEEADDAERVDGEESDDDGYADGQVDDIDEFAEEDGDASGNHEAGRGGEQEASYVPRHLKRISDDKNCLVNYKSMLDPPKKGAPRGRKAKVERADASSESRGKKKSWRGRGKRGRQSLGYARRGGGEWRGGRGGGGAKQAPARGRGSAGGFGNISNNPDMEVVYAGETIEFDDRKVPWQTTNTASMGKRMK